ncbi:MAG: purine-nucleoside phosphorylase [Bacteroidota bacterium]
MLKLIHETIDFLKSQGIDQVDTGIILGTGLGGLINHIEIEKEVAYEDIPHFPVATVEFHKGKLVYGSLAGKKVLAMQGRFHYYEGYSMQEVTYPVRVMKFLGIKHLLISNAAGCLNTDWNKGELMLLDDHINLQPANPLRGVNVPEFGPIFTDMSAPYNQELNQQLKSLASAHDIQLRVGVYVAVEGPNLETRAEYRYLRGIGADAVGMSTVPEVIVANQMDLPCCAISVMTDDCDPDNLKPVDIDEIIAIAQEAEKDLIKLYQELIKSI